MSESQDQLLTIRAGVRATVGKLPLTTFVAVLQAILFFLLLILQMGWGASSGLVTPISLGLVAALALSQWQEAKLKKDVLLPMLDLMREMQVQLARLQPEGDGTDPGTDPRG